MLTRSLHRLYDAAGALAGVFLVAICVIVTAQIVARQLGTIIPSVDQYAGFCLAATSFLGLAYSFRGGSHIRVTLFVQGLRGKPERALLVLALATAAAITLLLAWHTVAMVIQNFSRGEVTSGLVPMPLWVPQRAWPSASPCSALPFSKICSAPSRAANRRSIKRNATSRPARRTA